MFVDRLKLLPLLLTLALLLGVMARNAAHGTPADAAPFHARARDAIRSIPTRIGEWEWDGQTIQVPPAAQALLRPNELFNRRYRNTRTGRSANLIIVQCRDTRDMSGHYPPNCYPAGGWSTAADPVPVTMHIWDRSIPCTEYQFGRREFSRAAHIAILNTFILPALPPVPDMRGVREAAADYTTRHFGAAQFQVILDGSTPPDDRARIARELLEPLRPVFDALRLPPGRTR